MENAAYIEQAAEASRNEVTVTNVDGLAESAVIAAAVVGGGSEGEEEEGAEAATEVMVVKEPLPMALPRVRVLVG